MADPRQLQFWIDEEAELWDDVAPLVLDVFFEAVKGGQAALPPSVQVLLDFDTVNEAAIEYLRQYRLKNIAPIFEHTRNQTSKTIENWIRSGESLDVLKAQLSPLYGPERAERIAVREVNTILAEGNQEAWKSTGLVEENRWRTAMDDRVCEICEPLEDMVVGLGENEFTTEEGGLGISGPPAHTRCRCWLQPVVSEKGFREQVRSILEELCQSSSKDSPNSAAAW